MILRYNEYPTYNILPNIFFTAQKDNFHEQSTGVAQIQVYGVSFDAVMKSTSAMNATLAVSKAYLDDIMESNTSQFKR